MNKGDLFISERGQRYRVKKVIGPYNNRYTGLKEGDIVATDENNDTIGTIYFLGMASFTIKRFDGQSGDGVDINEAPYYGTRGWVVNSDDSYSVYVLKKIKRTKSKLDLKTIRRFYE